RELTPRNWGGSFDSCVLRVNRYLNGWIGYFRLCTGTGSFGFVDARIPRRLRALIVRQKKRPRHLYRHLLRRGISRGLPGNRPMEFVVTGNAVRASAFTKRMEMRGSPNAWSVCVLVGTTFTRWGPRNN
ncbi:MAG: hypothetical protein GY880_01740, partial [Planctomycetaceae bacterium]|nr:hypothetical protein [Planctomycetaceae bacterium]